MRLEQEAPRDLGLRLACIAAALLVLGAAGEAAGAEPCTPKDAVRIGGLKARACASSTLAPVARYSVKNAFDGRASSAWVEGVDGGGGGELIVLAFEQPVTLTGFVLLPGYTKSKKTFLENRAPGRLALAVDGKEVGEYEIPYRVDMDEESETQACELTEDDVNLAPRLVVLEKPVAGKSLRLTIKDPVGSPRTKYSDTAVSEWLPLIEEGKGGGVPPLVKAVAEHLRRYARTGELDRAWLARGAQLEDVLAPRRDIGADWLQEGVRQELAQAGADATRSPLENFGRIARGSLVGAPVTLYSRGQRHHVIGARLFSVGDGEWIELYPTLTLGSGYEVRQLGALISGGGAPGCHGVLPSPQP